jgi:hypothetical protein
VEAHVHQQSSVVDLDLSRLWEPHHNPVQLDHSKKEKEHHPKHIHL